MDRIFARDRQRHERQFGRAGRHQVGPAASLVLRNISSGPNASTSWRSRCSKRLAMRILFRAAIPNTVRTGQRFERQYAVAKAASSPPTSAVGNSTNVTSASRTLARAACSNRKIP